MELLGKYDHKKVEALVRDYWKAEKIPQKLAGKRKGAKKFYLLDGPPYINALPHVGHIKTTACKDIWLRLKYMQGFDTFIQAGFDCHGLPIEVMVEKELGIKSKKDVEEMGIYKFDEACLQKVENNEKTWMQVYDLLGAWKAYFEPYFTYKPYYIESAWWTLKNLHEKGFLVEGEKPIHWCPHCETALSGYEVSDSYKEVSDPSIYLKYKVKGKKNEFLLVWTTTPWTICANVGVAVHPTETYVKVHAKEKDEYYILAEKRVSILNDLGVKCEVVERVKGEELDGLHYEPILDVEQQQELAKNKECHRVYLGIATMAKKKYKKHETGADEEKEFQDFVTMSDGTGIVHFAPGHGQTDYFVGAHYGLPAVSPVDERGCFTDKVSWLQGKFVKAADKDIIARLDSEGKLLHSGKITHSYPLCWRCKTPLIFRLSKQWYLSIDQIKDKMIKANESVDWMPPYGKEAFHNWLADARDWCVSQQRFWGIPMPIWLCECGRKHVIGSVNELREKAVKDPGELEDLHRHSIDGIEIKCECGKTATRIKDIFNVWFDSSIAPWASLGYPYQNKELFEQLAQKGHLVDLINESQDQIRGWFYVLTFTGMAVFDRKAFNKVGMMGWVVDDKGEKMSKSQGNVVWAQDGIDKIGADAVRLYYCWEIAPWDVQKFSFETARDVQRALNIVWNSFAFYNAYKPSGFQPAQPQPATKEDEWILSRLNTVIGEVTEHYEKFELHHVGRKIVSFALDDFSRWYIKLCRDRAGDGDEAVFHVMHYVLDKLARMLAPITPFISEYVYLQLGGKDSVHFQDFPTQDGTTHSVLEHEMANAMQITEAVNSLRKEAGLKLRWPVKQVVVTGKEYAGAVENLQLILLASANSLQVMYSDSEPEGEFAVKELKDGKVFLDKTRDDQLINLALYRELVRAVQASRKQAGFNVKDEIAITVSASPQFSKFLEQNAPAFARDVTAKAVAITKDASSLEGEHSAEASLEELKASAKYSKA